MKFSDLIMNKIALGVVGLVIVVLGVALALGGGGKGSTSSTTSTQPVMTHTVSQQAVIASLSVARAALYNTPSKDAKVTAKDVSAAALPDKGTLIVLKNLGEIPGYSNYVAFQWDFGGAPLLVCVQLPQTRAGAVAKVDCPSGIRTVKPPTHVTATTKPIRRRGSTTSTTTKLPPVIKRATTTTAPGVSSNTSIPTKKKK